MIVLDTHAWIWWVSEPQRLPRRATTVIDASIEGGDSLRISSISAWEVAMLIDRGRLELTMDVSQWVAKCEAIPFLEFIPVDNRIALGAVRLPEFPNRDPADRLIVSTALSLDATLVTADERLRRYRRMKTVWA